MKFLGVLDLSHMGCCSLAAEAAEQGARAHSAAEAAGVAEESAKHSEEAAESLTGLTTLVRAVRKFKKRSSPLGRKAVQARNLVLLFRRNVQHSWYIYSCSYGFPSYFSWQEFWQNFSLQGLC